MKRQLRALARPFVAAFKAASSAVAVVFTGRGGSGLMWGASRFSRAAVDYAAAVGDGRGSSILMACVLWMARAYPEAPLRVQRRKADGTLEVVRDHPMIVLLANPNPYYSGVLLWMALLADWMLSGNAYLLKVRSGAGRVIELYWIPSWMIEPTWPTDGSAYISGYLYRPDGKAITYAFDDVVHIRYGLDPLNTRKGLSPLASLFREVFTDEEAAAFTAALLRNMGVPGLIISPASSDVELTKEDAEDIKLQASQRYGGDNRGATMTVSAPMSVASYGFNPQQMDLKALRRIPEERISAIFGTPAVVVGLGAGLDRSTFANFSEAREAAYESNIIPTQRLMAAELTSQLLPDFSDPGQYEVDHDLSKVRVLQVDENDLHSRIRQDVQVGLLTLNQARELLGWDQMDGGDVLLIPAHVIPTDAANLLDAIPITTPKPVVLPAEAQGAADTTLAGVGGAPASTAPKNGTANGVAA
jgi:HK97 family phage portal protein